MTTRPPVPTESIECPLCLGAGKLKRTEILDRLGVKDFARVAQLSAEEAFRLLTQKHNHDHQSVWSRFETELAKRTAEIRERHKDELRSAQSDRDDLTRRVEDCLREVAQLRERNQELEGEMSKAARRGKLEEISFEEEARTWAGIASARSCLANGDFILAYRDPSGAPLEPCILVDNKDKATVSEGDIRKLIRDVKERRSPVGVIVAREESQLRQLDRERRWGQEDGSLGSANDPALAATRPRSAQTSFRADENRGARLSPAGTPRWQKKSAARSLIWTKSRKN